MSNPETPQEIPPAAHGVVTAAALDGLAEALAEDRPLPPSEAEAARALCAERGEEIYADLIWALTDLRYEAPQARQLWQEVLDHKYLMSERLGRNVGIRVAGAAPMQYEVAVEFTEIAPEDRARLLAHLH